MSHTKGPWTVDPRVDTHVIAGDHRGICSTGGHQDSRMDPSAMALENAANARLIAAAPDLLAALRYVLSENPHYCASPLVHCALVAAEGR